MKHWCRWQRFGDPEARLRGEVRDGKRICPQCTEDKPLAEFGDGRRPPYCKRCAADRAVANRRANPRPRVAGEPKDCRCCGQTFMANKRRSIYCSRDCFARHRTKANWKHMQARRARLAAAFVESFDRIEIFERDDWVCQICLSPVDREAKPPDPRSPSLDHIIPISRGGEHSRANAQTACLGCNVRKGARLAA